MAEEKKDELPAPESLVTWLEYKASRRTSGSSPSMLYPSRQNYNISRFTEYSQSEVYQNRILYYSQEGLPDYPYAPLFPQDSLTDLFGKPRLFLNMHAPQRDWYQTWRKHVINGQRLETDRAYVILLFQELLSKKNRIEDNCFLMMEILQNNIDWMYSMQNILMEWILQYEEKNNLAIPFPYALTRNLFLDSNRFYAAASIHLARKSTPLNLSFRQISVICPYNLTKSYLYTNEKLRWRYEKSIEEAVRTLNSWCLKTYKRPILDYYVAQNTKKYTEIEHAPSPLSNSGTPFRYDFPDYLQAPRLREMVRQVCLQTENIIRKRYKAKPVETDFDLDPALRSMLEKNIRQLFRLKKSDIEARDKQLEEDMYTFSRKNPYGVISDEWDQFLEETNQQAILDFAHEKEKEKVLARQKWEAARRKEKSQEQYAELLEEAIVNYAMDHRQLYIPPLIELRDEIRHILASLDQPLSLEERMKPEMIAKSRAQEQLDDLPAHVKREMVKKIPSKKQLAILSEKYKLPKPDPQKNAPVNSDPKFDDIVFDLSEEGLRQAGYLPRLNSRKIQLQKPAAPKPEAPKPVSRPKLRLDMFKINQLRKESDEVRQMLYVEEEEPGFIAEKADSSALPAKEKEPEQAALPDTNTETALDTGTGKNAGTDAGASIASFLDSLEDYEKETIRVLVQEPDSDIQIQTLEEIASAQFLMPEMLADQINEKFSEYFDDLLLDTMEEIPVILDEYKEDVQDWVNKNYN